MVLLPLLYGVATAVPLVVGTGVGIYLQPPRAVVASLLAFASGALVTGLAFELFEPAYRSVGLPLTTVGLFVGTGLYVAVKATVDHADEEASGFPLLAAVVFDGLAENVTLGVVLAGDPESGPLAILAGVAANNLPEAVGGAGGMVEAGRSSAWTLAVWTGVSVGLVLAVPAGYTLFAGAGRTVLALVQATGGGALLASLAVEIMPDAYRGGGPWVAFATAAGFVTTFVLA